MIELNDLFSQLHKELVQDLLTRIRSGQATADELNVARQMLKDIGIEASPVKDRGLEVLAKILPFTADDMKQYGS
jgi:hypothetical protein